MMAVVAERFERSEKSLPATFLQFNRPAGKECLLLLRTRIFIIIINSWWGWYMLQVAELPVWAQILLQDSSTQPRERNEQSISCLVLLAHGSKDPRWREPFERLYLSVRADTGERVRMAYMEFISPTLFEVVEECAAEGFREIRILPLFMAAGAHLASDVPEQVREIRRKLPKMRFEVLPPIGEDDRLVSLMKQLVREKLVSRVE